MRRVASACIRNRTSRLATSIAMIAIFSAGTLHAHSDDDHGGLEYDNLKRVEKSRVERAYIDPDANFGEYRRIKILHPYVAFRKNWRRDQNRDRSQRISARDVERIKTRVARLFAEVFTKTLESHGRFEIVEETGEDVLILRPAIIDLDIAAPDTLSTNRETTFTTSAGAATLYLELFDSVSGAIIGRAVDRRSVRGAAGSLAWTNRGTNVAEARRLFGGWAELLRDFLDRHAPQPSN